MSVDTFERRVELPPAAPGQWLTPHVGPLNGTGRDNRRTARAIVVPGDELWRGSCPIRPD